MRITDTFILIDSGDLTRHDAWAEVYEGIERAARAVTWPLGSDDFRIPVINKIGVKSAKYNYDSEYITENGEIVKVVRKPKIKNALGKEITLTEGEVTEYGNGKYVTYSRKGIELRNGVNPIKACFCDLMVQSGWNKEEPLRLGPTIEKLLGASGNVFKYPLREPASELRQSVGDLDFWLTAPSGFRVGVEWETGNISSSHRSLNKLFVALYGQLLDAAVVMVPSNNMKVHLTDRIGNIGELQPYFGFYGLIGRLVEKGVFAIVVVEQDKTFKSNKLCDFIGRGGDGNSKNIPRPSSTK